MLNCLKESFKLTNKYIILATPLILFSLLSSLYILFSLGGNLISLIIAFILFTLMLSAFLSGWFFMIRECIKKTDNEDPNALIKFFPEGVSRPVRRTSEAVEFCRIEVFLRGDLLHAAVSDRFLRSCCRLCDGGSGGRGEPDLHSGCRGDRRNDRRESAGNRDRQSGQGAASLDSEGDPLFD